VIVLEALQEQINIYRLGCIAGAALCHDVDDVVGFQSVDGAEEYSDYYNWP